MAKHSPNQAREQEHPDLAPNARARISDHRARKPMRMRGPILPPNVRANTRIFCAHKCVGTSRSILRAHCNESDTPHIYERAFLASRRALVLAWLGYTVRPSHISFSYLVPGENYTCLSLRRPLREHTHEPQQRRVSEPGYNIKRSDRHGYE